MYVVHSDIHIPFACLVDEQKSQFEFEIERLNAALLKTEQDLESARNVKQPEVVDAAVETDAHSLCKSEHRRPAIFRKSNSIVNAIFNAPNASSPGISGKLADDEDPLMSILTAQQPPAVTRPSSIALEMPAFQHEDPLAKIRQLKALSRSLMDK